MNWQQFKDYLENNIIENEEGKWILKDEAINKYLGESASTTYLETAIIRLMFSLRGTIDNLAGFHHLPTYQSQLTWEQLISRNIALGERKGEEHEELDTATYNLLGDIFRDWQEEQLEEEPAYEFPSFTQERTEEDEKMVHDNLNWDEFRYWLNNNILDADNEISAEATTKYHINNTSKLLTALDNLIESTEHSNDSNYYHLPHFCSASTNWKGEEEPRVKTWLELFPTCERALFGRRTQRAIIDSQTFTILGAMHSDFIRFNKLADELNEESFLTKFMMEAIVHLNINLIKQKGYDKFLTNWLSEYEKLTEQEQESLHVQKSMAEKFISIIADESNTQSSFWTKFKQHGYTIAWISGGILLIIFVWGWIKSKTK